MNNHVLITKKNEPLNFYKFSTKSFQSEKWIFWFFNTFVNSMYELKVDPQYICIVAPCSKLSMLFKLSSSITILCIMTKTNIVLNIVDISWLARILNYCSLSLENIECPFNIFLCFFSHFGKMLLLIWGSYMAYTKQL